MDEYPTELLFCFFCLFVCLFVLFSLITQTHTQTECFTLLVHMRTNCSGCKLKYLGTELQHHYHDHNNNIW